MKPLSVLPPVVIALLGAQTPLQIYGLWHCYTDACSWESVPDMKTFDTDNHWIVDRGNGHPSVNLVVLSFVNPVKLMNLTTDSGNVNGIPYCNDHSLDAMDMKPRRMLGVVAKPVAGRD